GDGRYHFGQLAPGIYHVRQHLEPGTVQTFPTAGYVNAADGLPDEVVAYQAGSDGPLDGPIGRVAESWNGPRQIVFPAPAQTVNLDLLLKPIGNRGETPQLGVWSTTEFVALSKEAEVTLRFDEGILNGEGFDFAIHALDSPAGEEIEVFAGESEDALVPLGTFRESSIVIGVDLADTGITGPVHFVKIRSLNSAGAFPGFDLVGVEAFHFLDPSATSHNVVISGNKSIDNLHFGRIHRNLPPSLVLSLENESGEFAVGQPFGVVVQASDDLGEPTVILMVDGNPVPIDSNRAVVVPESNGPLTLVARATDESGQVSERSLTLTIGGGADPDRDTLAVAEAGAPTVRLLEPQPGSVWNMPVSVRALIEAPTSDRIAWSLDFAPADLVDPNHLSEPDEDYQPLFEGSGLPADQRLGPLPVNNWEPGIYFLRLTTSFVGGSTRYLGWAIGVGIEEDALRPSVAITAPGPGESVSLRSAVKGSIESERPIASWAVKVAPATAVVNAPDGDAHWKLIAEGMGKGEENFGVLDGSLLPNGSYFLRLRAVNDLGIGHSERIPIEVTGEAKLGRLRREFVDFTTTIGGLPVEMRRVYDSLRLEEAPGELGPGWSFGFSDPMIRETVPDTGLTPFSASPFRVGTRIYINAPDGRRLGFTFQPQPGAGSFLGQSFQATFVPDPGVTATL
ncbi:MAG: hypothetical protein AAF514_21380, partial [Verrucomicrobiota bacterium]